MSLASLRAEMLRRRKKGEKPIPSESRTTNSARDAEEYWIYETIAKRKKVPDVKTVKSPDVMVLLPKWRKLRKKMGEKADEARKKALKNKLA